MTDSRRRLVTLGRLQVRFFVKAGIERTPTQPLANAYAPLHVSTPEATAFDLVRYASRIGGIGRAVETLVPLLPLIRGTELKRLLEAENETSTAQRLGYIIERKGNAKLAEAIHDWLPSPLALKKFGVSYRSMARPGDTITCTGTIVNKYEKDGLHLLDCDIAAENQRGEKCAIGNATVALPRRS